MAAEFHLRVQAIIEAALQVAPDRRNSFVEQACEQDAALLGEVRSLLPHYEQTLEYEPSRGPDWFLPGTTTIAKAGEAAAADPIEEEDPEPPFCIDQYRCESVLGRGGMGIVYLAVHATLRRRFAIKLLLRGLLSSEDRWRFAFEADLLRRLQHPGIARLYHVNEVRREDETRPYFIMEYVQGRSLVRFARWKGLNVLERLRLLALVSDAVEYAHRRGITHRDLKPGNILVDDQGQPKVLDFGIARIEQFMPASGDDRPGRFVGTYQYASPEQKAGKNDALTPRSDVYSLGLIAHELLTGRLPQTVEGDLRLDLDRVDLDGCRPSLAARQKEFRYFLRILFSAALARSPGDRYGSAGRLGAALSAIGREFDRPTGWAALRSRLAHWLSRGTPPAAGDKNPLLSAVLRTRIAMSMKSNPTGLSTGQPTPPASSETENAGETYHVRDPEL